ncbi:alpha/beta fold hydrolase [Bowmanella denitrificans]|uniref:alpha/beta fold hydrolase n=1 Tax=Bowmanella denitrificans TaxID=366582 RepID=UPI000C99BECD|nr:alpha/beta hydrolase [Bowmanella denitrificans]
MMKVVLIPGMDGTGRLFEPFIESAPAGLEVITVPLIQDAAAGYIDQAQYVVDTIGDEPLVLVAESYSGMVAYNMLNIGCKNIRHIIFAASFISSPSWMASLARYLPVSVLKSRFVPNSILGKILFGRFSSSKLIAVFYEALDHVSNDVLDHRLKQIATLKYPVTPIEIPCSYIRPKDDKLVSRAALEPFSRLCHKLTVHEVDGTHFVLQTNPKQCWSLIQGADV